MTRSVLLVVFAALALAFPATVAALGVSQLPGKDGCLHPDRSDCARAIGTEGSVAAVVSPDGKHVYVASGAASFGSLTSFSRDPATGALTQLPGERGCVSSTGRGEQNLGPQVCRKGNGLPFLNDVAISKDGLTIYTLSRAGFEQGQAVDTFRRDPDTGEVTQMQCFTARPNETGCTQAALQLPDKIALTPDNRTLIAAGESISTFAVGDDGRITDNGTCLTVLTAKPDPDYLCRNAPRDRRLSPIESMSLSSDGKRLYATAGLGGRRPQLQAYAVDAKARTVKPRACAGVSREGAPCRSARRLRDAFDVAVSPDGRGVYTASSRFVETDEEDGSGYLSSSTLGAFRAPKLGQLPGRRGCVLFAAERGSDKTCAKAPSKRGRGFLGASTIAVTPNGRYALGGFSQSSAVALLKRNARTQALTPVMGRSGCVAEPGKRTVKGCGEGRGIGFVRDIAIAPDGRNAYLLNDEGLAVFRLR